MKRYFILILLSLSLSMGLIIAPDKSEAASQYSDNLIPIMTSNTSPSGVASASSACVCGYSAAYTAFDGTYASTQSYAWTTTDNNAAWLKYEFSNPLAIAQYVIYPQYTASSRAPKNWTFEGSNDGTNWTVLDTQSNVTGWANSTPKNFVFSNTNKFKSYRINITANSGDASFLSIGELQMMSKILTPDPSPDPSGKRAILTITMTNGLEKEYDLSMAEVNAFIVWYDGKDVGTGPAKYKFDKTWNKGPFKARTEYVIFDKILTFSVDEYDVVTP
ncbi:hypothetical protein BC351_00015 [Paenibacillus ferrarius]|uniref:F5/8 type C domain-containing protein n=1 Tax=Paenibacillus ferrarius TaxID=1469647 RepID=A0A1V4HSW3_9BACL|nr:discoidin domain-containing protein [Paenibacillus ferrarius]OPH61665.1 hypothetical protein BC351_00015 [Paenibacillus ferrarius]